MKPLSVVVRTGCDIFAWFMVVFGSYVIIHGVMTPGGGFQGGAVAATFIALLLVAYGWKRLKNWLNEGIYNGMIGFGLLSFIVLGFMGMPTSFFYNFISIPAAEVAKSGHGIFHPSGTIALMNLAVGFEVVGELSLLIIHMFKGTRLFDTYEIGGESGHDR
ncbi:MULTISPECIES: MnhB domain-containing protein [Aminobacterium]|jgi:multisubunit Na+/H+ antiporter MnhB subunit|uniref:Na+/H+ antiporter MnhB subunit-related protein n=1 Tax=Aminobacterium colombiense (strain DSM 12261 / ALA-1) TaxID=572547 RepID=D5EFQ9_AMICL|nr:MULTISPECIES: MnhB domain-containing protein [Aminobacterium]MDD2379629.1 MnhB domain-containing protein [Aminobacterium colombiense]ADE57391.1 Na+/H+ antiporter MnhB subunit-related protein [Aminobacterium colombiense DSM 12261]MDD3768173.1 MnhB domain-containing protein [Aminobacterium colombiense]MDD4265494.1 MnhB domain-containing protein [Aminobacterium colombiense]MDD4585537.1 MnhB domain-containing protein [Aminobacterium colombiense]